MREMAIALLLLVFINGCSAEKPAEKVPSAAVVSASVAGNAVNGKRLIDQYACLSCHKIPGFDGPQGSMGPSLEAFATRKVIAGRIPNQPDTVAAYLQNPQAVDPQNQMPPLGVSESEARDMTAYLMTLK
jgi:cytochrome c